MDANDSTSAIAFAVLQFSIEMDAGGLNRQDSFSYGVFASVEEAFEMARRLAVREFIRIRQHAREMASESAHPVDAVELVDTEWGYDLRRGCLVVTRFWVHERPATLFTWTTPIEE